MNKSWNASEINKQRIHKPIKHVRWLHWEGTDGKPLGPSTFHSMIVIMRTGER